MSKAQTFKKQLKPGTIYRRSDLKQWSKSVDRELKNLIMASKDHLTKEFIFIELVNNLKYLAEDQSRVLEKVYKKVTDMNTSDFREALRQYGTPQTRKLLATVI